MEKLNKYKTWLISKGLSDKTIKTYMSILKSISKKLDIKKFNKEVVTEYLISIKEKYSPATVCLYREVIRSLKTFLGKEFEIPIIIKRKKLRKIHKVLSENRFQEELLPLIPELFNKPLKVEAVLTFLFYTGIRREELISLQRNDIDLIECNAKIHGKGDKERIVFFQPDIKETLNTFFESEPEIKNAFNTSEKSIRGICERLNEHFEDLHIHPHLFRHSFATMFINKGGRESQLKLLLGHSDIKTTELYLQFAHKDIENSYREVFSKKEEKNNEK